MEMKGLNDNKVTIKAGISSGLIGKARKKGGSLSQKNLSKILYAYPDLSPEWLMTGRGSMLKEQKQYPTQTQEPSTAPYQTGFNKPADSFSTASGHLDAEKLSLYILNHVKELEQQPIFMSYIKQKAYEIALDIVTEKLSK